MIVAGLIFFVFSRQILGAFTDDPAVTDHGDGAMMALALILPPWAYQSVFGGSLRALGDARTPMLTNMAATWLAIGIAWAGVLWWEAELTFVWAALVITSPIMMLTMLAFRRGLESTRETFEADTPPPLPV